MSTARRVTALVVAGTLATIGVCTTATLATQLGAATTRCPAPDTPATAPVVGGDETPGITRIQFTFVRPPCRVLRTAVHFPTGATTPLPLILTVHGRDGDPSALRPLLDTWASAGYVVAAPSFLVTDKDADDTPTGAAVARQAADARFVIDQLLGLADDASGPLHDLIDPRRIGAAGMSLGGMTVYGLISNTCCRDRRIGAAILMAAVRRPFPGGAYVRQDVPVVLVQGDQDPGYHNSLSAYPKLAPPKWFITLRGAQHSPPFEIPRGPEDVLVDAATTAFWNRYLRGELGSADQIVTAVRAAHGRATLRRNAP
jgi:dienelactone hydrolase